MKKNENRGLILVTILAAIFVTCYLVFVVTYETPEEKPETKEIDIIFENIWSLPIENVYGSGDCAEPVEKIKAQRMENLNKIQYRERGDMSWYAAGLALGIYYIAQDCDNAKEKIDEIIDELWLAGDEYGQSDKLDDITTAMRYIKNVLPK